MSSSALKKSLSSHSATGRARGRTLPQRETSPAFLPAESIDAVGTADAAQTSGARAAVEDAAAAHRESIHRRPFPFFGGARHPPLFQNAAGQP